MPENAVAPTSSGHLLGLVIVAAFLPPLAVGIEFGCGSKLALNILLSLLPMVGFIHAVYLLFNERYVPEQPQYQPTPGNGYSGTQAANQTAPEVAQQSQVQTQAPEPHQAPAQQAHVPPRYETTEAKSA